MIAAIATGAPVALLVGSAPPRIGAPALVVAPPWVDATKVTEAAGGRPVGPLNAPLAVLASFDDVGFPQSARSAGAWLVLDGAAIAAWCGVEAI